MPVDRIASGTEGNKLTMEKELSVLIVEDVQAAKDFLKHDKCTYAAIFKATSRSKITNALDEIQNNE